jgi:PAS domain S-box-containing protein
MIDLRTLIAVIGIIHLVQLIVFIVLYYTSSHYKGVRMWLWWCAAEFIGFAFLLLRQIPSLFEISVVLQNSFIVAGTLFLYTGVRQFYGKDPHAKITVSAFVLFFLLICIFLFIYNDILVRSFFINVILAVVAVPTFITMFRDRPESVRITAYFTGIIMVVHSLVFFIRTLIIVTNQRIGQPYDLTLFNLLGFFDALVVGVFWTYGFVIMVTQRMNAELKEVKDRFESIYMTSPDAIVITRLADGWFIEINPAFTAMSGYTREDIIGKSSIDINIWKDPSDRDKVVSQLRQKGFAENFEFVFKRKDHSQFTGLMSARIIQFGGTMSILSTTRDISERKQSEIEGAETEKRHRAYSSLMSELISRGGLFRYSLDENLRNICEVTSKIMECERISIWSFNANFSQLSCLNLFRSSQNEHCVEEPLNSNEFPLYLNELKQGQVIAAEDVFNNRITSELPQEYFSSNKIFSMMDVPFWLEGSLRGVVCFENTGKRRNWLADEKQFSVTVASLVSMSFEIAERKKAEADLITARNKAEEADRLKSVFLANMSHEIRTPMNSIVGFAQLLTDESLTGQERDHYSSIIQSRSDDLMHIINELLEISRIESGNAKVVMSAVNLNRLLEEAETLAVQKLQRLNKNSISFELLQPLKGRNIQFTTDPYILKQVFTNLIDNAIKYTPAGKIRAGYEPPVNGMISFFVEDTGVGISEQNQKVIFEHFRQADIEDAHVYGGSGLGLSICRGSLALLDGTIEVKSRLGEGSRFVFTLPFEDVTNNGTFTGTAAGAEVQKKAVEKWPGKRILLVEDEASNMEYLIAILNRTGTELTCAYNGKQLREFYKMLDQFDLVLLDVRLPDAIGWELAREIKSFRPDLPVVAQTAFAMSSDYEKSRESGCDDYISKPIRRETLIKLMDKFLSA